MQSDVKLGSSVKFRANSGDLLQGEVVKVNPKTFKVRVDVSASGKPIFRWINRHKRKHAVELLG